MCRRESGNPLRAAFTQRPGPVERFAGRTGPLGLLVVGGSLGERAVNEPVLSLVGTTRNQQAYRAHLRSQGTTQLPVDYLQARGVQGQPGAVTVNGHTVQVELAAGLADPAAPPGGMAHNLRTPAAAGTPR